LLPLCLERRVSVIAGGVFNSGLLSGGRTYDYHAAPPEMIAKTESLRAICARYEIPLAAAAIQFPLRHPAVTSLVVGARSAAEVQADLEFLALPIPEEFWAEPGIAQIPI
jgi:D-threo-aldose 1-dehydrogenase